MEDIRSKASPPARGGRPTATELARFTFDQAGDPIFWVDAHGRFVDANRAACERLGYTRDELIRRRVFDIDAIVTEVDWPLRWARLRSAGTGRIESVHRHRAGSEFPVEINSHFIQLDGEELTCVFVRDLTARKAAEREILRGRQWIELVADAAALGLWDWNIRDGTKVCNDEYFRTLGWSRDDFGLGFESYRGLVHPEDRDSAYEHLQRHLAGQTAMIDSEYRIRTEEGRWIWILDRGRVLERDDDGRPVRVAGVIQDITKRKSDEQRALRLARLDHICQEIAASFVRETDQDAATNRMLRKVGQFLDVSRSYVFCFRDNGATLCNTHEWCNDGVEPQVEQLQSVSADSLEVLLEPMRDCRPLVITDLDEAAIDQVARDHLASQSIRATIGFPFFIDGDMRGIIGFDETRGPREWLGEEIALLQTMVESFARAVERREAEQARAAAASRLREALRDAEAANTAKDAFLAHMSHELRTPLTAVLGFAEMLERGPSSESARRSLINQIRNNGRQLLNIINDLLDLSRIEADKIEAQLSRVELLPLLVRAVRMLEPIADNKRLSIRLRVASRVPKYVATDESRVLQILTNLLSNAVKYTEHGHVDLVASCEDSTLRLCVEDTGVGIAAHRVASVFEPFERDTSDPRRQGTGLGLPISRRLAGLLGGTISCRSTLGSGSCFTLELPVAEQGPWLESGPIAAGTEQDEGTTTAIQRTGLLDGLRVLLVEDSKQNRDVIEFFLQEQGADVSWCGNGALAIARMRDAQDEIDMVLMDMRMPIMDGYTATRTARHNGFRKPIIAITAHSLAQDRQRCIEAGCDEHLTKPVDARRLVEVCRRFGATGVAAPSVTASSASPVSRKEPAGSARRSAMRQLQTLVNEYVAALPKQRTQIERAFASGAVADVRAMAHRLAGSAGSYGLPELSRVARACDQAIRLGAQPAELSRRVADLVDQMREAEVRSPETVELPRIA
ncbi:MAG: PAS domain S-box protein [Planctomycetota bacterium]|jgi:PAS domain S-box-containing protein